MTRPLAGLAIALALPLVLASAAASLAADARSLTVTGEATTSAKPDMAMVTAGVVTQAPTAAAALADNSKATAAVIDGLKGDGVEPRDLQTSNFSLQPVTVYPRADDGSSSGPPRITGYTVSNNVQVRVRDLSRLGAILDKAIGAGANSVNGIDFIVSRQSELLDGARKAAVEDARRKAALYAEAAGSKLGPIMTLSEQTIGPPPRPMYRMEAASAAPVPVEAGETTLRVEITAAYALE
jgi:uncharacterized protein YggE